MKKLSLILLGIFLFSCCFSGSDFDPDKDDKILKEICYDLPPPLKTKKIEEGAITKMHSGVFTIYYSHESDCKHIVNHYKKMLDERGWKMIPKSFFDSPELFEFKKKDFKISLTCSNIRTIRGIKNFSIDCSK